MINLKAEGKAMQMDIQSQGFVLTDGINDYITRRLAFCLNHGDEASATLAACGADDH